MNISRLLALAADILTAIAVFVPWIYGFSPPINKNLDVILLASPNLLDLALHSNYSYLLAVLVGLILGVAYCLMPDIRRKSLEVGLAATTLLLTLGPSFAFGTQYGESTGLYLDGAFVAYSTSLGPGSRVMELGATAYLFALLSAAFSD